MSGGLPWGLRVRFTPKYFCPVLRDQMLQRVQLPFDGRQGILIDEDRNGGIRLANCFHTHIDLRIERHLPGVPFCPMDAGEPSAPECVQERLLDTSKIKNILGCISYYGKMYAAHVLGNHPIPMAWGTWPLARHVARSEASAETGGVGRVSQPWDLG